MKKFDFYEFTGILTPGVILLYAVSLTVPAVTPRRRATSALVRRSPIVVARPVFTPAVYAASRSTAQPRRGHAPARPVKSPRPNAKRCSAKWSKRG